MYIYFIKVPKLIAIRKSIVSLEEIPMGCHFPFRKKINSSKI